MPKNYKDRAHQSLAVWAGDVTAKGVSGARHRRADADEVVDVFSRVPMTLSGSDASLPDVSSSSEDDEDAAVMDVLAPRHNTVNNCTVSPYLLSNYTNLGISAHPEASGNQID
ncbi:hypothetical protein evm_008870 [Chilo suppressalis]|nr:hypothetical protein evm_008870 [Chilo suppressalis]